MCKPWTTPWDSFIECDAIVGESDHTPRNRWIIAIYCDIGPGARVKETRSELCGPRGKSCLSARSFVSSTRQRVKLQKLYVYIKCVRMRAAARAHLMDASSLSSSSSSTMRRRRRMIRIIRGDTWRYGIDRSIREFPHNAHTLPSTWYPHQQRKTSRARIHRDEYPRSHHANKLPLRVEWPVGRFSG